MQKTPTPQEITAAVESAAAATQNAQAVRLRERGHKRLDRRTNLDEAIRRCGAIAATLRSYIGMCFAHEIDQRYELGMRNAVADLDRERRKLRKMLDR